MNDEVFSRGWTDYYFGSKLSKLEFSVLVGDFLYYETSTILGPIRVPRRLVLVLLSLGITFGSDNYTSRLVKFVCLYSVVLLLPSSGTYSGESTESPVVALSLPDFFYTVIKFLSLVLIMQGETSCSSSWVYSLSSSLFPKSSSMCSAMVVYFSWLRSSLKPTAILALRVSPEKFFKTVKNVLGSWICSFRRIVFTQA